MKTFFPVLLIMIGLLSSCVMEERYHFDKNLAGSYTVNLDYAVLAEMDSTGAFMEGIKKGMDSVLNELKHVKGVNELRSEVGKESASLTFGFNDLETVNTIQNEEGEPKQYFSKTANGLKCSTNLDNVFGLLSEEPKEEMTKEAIDQMNNLIQVKTIISFDNEVKVLKSDNMRKIGPRMFEFDTKQDGFVVAPMLEVEFK